MSLVHSIIKATCTKACTSQVLACLHLLKWLAAICDWKNRWIADSRQGSEHYAPIDQSMINRNET